jgi:hypothetical protein
MARRGPSSAHGDPRSIGLPGRMSPTIAGRRGDEAESADDRGQPVATPTKGPVDRGMGTGTEGSDPPPVAIGARRP